MAFDAGHRPYQPQPPPPERKTLEDHLDFVLRAVVLLPLLGLYTWRVFTILRDFAFALIVRFTG
ncbi:MAG: hypothetical protein JNJ63_11115 [Hyphomonadaceae bacterium]|nr:hypothetical protein [Hyphomonadaceae bacterium]